MRLPVSRLAAALTALTIAAAAGAQAANGPAADYPVTIGAAYEIDGTTFTPLDTLNYDAVGHALIGSAGGSAISGAHHTLPVPSYVEVTSLVSGRTILVRLDRRGPMASKSLVELSPAAAQQLGIGGQADAPVRVRRVNPPEIERAMLRSGGQAPVRMDTPMGLVGVLKRKLDQQDIKAAPQLAAQAPAATAAVVPPHAEPSVSAARPAVAANAGSYVVQVGVFAHHPNASKAASALGTEPQPSGKLWRVRMGPFADRAAADAALAKARSAGYTDARIQRTS